MTEPRPAAGVEEAVLSVEGVSVWLAGREVLHDVRFRAMPGSSPV